MRSVVKHPFVIFTDFPWVWGPLYGTGLLIGLMFAIRGELDGVLFFIGGVIGSFMVISFWSIILWVLTKYV
jgi:hypothetical protein